MKIIGIGSNDSRIITADKRELAVILAKSERSLTPEDVAVGVDINLTDLGSRIKEAVEVRRKLAEKATSLRDAADLIESLPSEAP